MGSTWIRQLLRWRRWKRRRWRKRQGRRRREGAAILLLICSFLCVFLTLKPNRPSCFKERSQHQATREQEEWKTTFKRGQNHRGGGSMAEGQNHGHFELTKLLKSKEVELAELPGWLEYCGYCLCPGTLWLPHFSHVFFFL